MSLIGYARVSTQEQIADLQEDALRAAGCERVYTDHASGSTTSRPQLDACLGYLRPGDVLVVWRFDRLGRSLRHLLDVVAALEARGIEFQSVTEKIDTTSPGGRLIFHIMASIAEFERSLIRERTLAGLAAARAQGRTGGRPSILTAKRRAEIVAARDRETNVTTIAEVFGVSRATVYRVLDAAEQQSQEA